MDTLTGVVENITFQGQNDYVVFRLKTEQGFVVVAGNIGAPVPGELLKARLLARSDQRIGSDGVVTIKAQEHRSQPRNREAAIERLRELLEAAATIPRRRIATAPTRASRERRLDTKTKKGAVKAGRGRVREL